MEGEERVCVGASSPVWLLLALGRIIGLTEVGVVPTLLDFKRSGRDTEASTSIPSSRCEEIPIVHVSIHRGILN